MTSSEAILANGLQPNGRVGKALRSAAQASGVDFDYLLKTAFRESSFRPALKADTSSATGLFQFIEQTWLETIKNDGSRFGLKQEADAIRQRRDGSYFVQDEARRQHILDLRKNPELSSHLAAALTQRNQAYLQEKTGLTPTAGELYIAHFLGAKGAADLISVARANPTLKAAELFPAAARANQAIFFDKAGALKTVQQVYSNLISQHNQTGEPLDLRPDPERTIATHAPDTIKADEKQEKTTSTAAEAAFLASHFGPPTAAFSTALDAYNTADRQFAGPGSRASFFLPRADTNSTNIFEPSKDAVKSSQSKGQVSAPLTSRYGNSE